MIEKNKKDLNQMEIVSIEDFVPKDYLLRKINAPKTPNTRKP